MSRCVVKVWQDGQPRPAAANAHQRVCAGQPHNANDGRQQPVTVRHFLQYYWVPFARALSWAARRVLTCR